MKKVYLMALAALFGSASMAQVSVTFQVDMNNETVSPNGVHVAGNWQDEAGFPGEWDPSTSEMTDDNSDGIYELTVDVPPGDYEYKFINDNAWGADESVPAVCQREGGTGNNNRVFVVSDWHADEANLPDGYVLPAVVFAGSAPVGQVAVRLQIDMSNETVSDLGVHVAGNFSTPVWTPQLSKAWEVGDGKYAFVANVPINAPYEYKFLNGDFWGTDESIPSECATNDNRFVAVGDVDVVTEPFCFGSCETCTPVIITDVTFIVDMSTVCNLSPDGAHIAGSFNGFNGVPMNDDGNGIYSITLPVDGSTYDFKFQNGLGGWEGNLTGDCAVEGGGNREISIPVQGEPVTYGPFCFGTCDAVCSPVPDPADITFKVDMNGETVAAEGVFLIGNFTTPNWQDGAIALDDSDADGIYETTVNICPGSFEYKFVNGDVYVSENDEFFGNPDQLACNIPSGNGGWNRVHTRNGEEETLYYAFNSCDPLSVSEIELGKVAIYPNPTQGNTFIELENPNGYTLRMEILDVTGKAVSGNELINSSRFEIKTDNLSPGLYFLSVFNQQNERATFKLMVQ